MSGYDEIVNAVVEQQAFEEQTEEPSFVDDFGNEVDEFADPNEGVYTEPETEQYATAIDQGLVQQFDQVQTPEQYIKLAQDVAAMNDLIANTPGAWAYRMQQQEAEGKAYEVGRQVLNEQLDSLAEANGAKIYDHAAARELAEKLNQQASEAAAREGQPLDPEKIALWAMTAAAKEASGNRTYKDVVDKFTTITGGTSVEVGSRSRFPKLRT